MSGSGKFSECKRRLHLDFHNPAGVPDIGVDFDEREFAETVRGAGFDGLTVFAMGHHGHCYFPTRKGRPHPSLRQDLLGGMVHACHEVGLKVAAYSSVGCNSYARSEWLQIDKSGKPRAFLEQGGYQMVCINSPHVEQNVLPVTAEVLERYPLDAMWYDMLFFFDEGCHCRYCLDRMARLGLNPEDPVDVRAHMRGSVDEFVVKSMSVIRQTRPDMETAYNGLSVHERPAGLTQSAYIDVEALATGGWGYFYIPTKVRYFRTLGKPVTGMTSAFHRSWGDFGTLKAQALLEHEVYTSLAAGAATVAIGDQMHPQGKLEPARYERIGEVLNAVARLEAWIAGATPQAEAAILLYPLAQGQFPGASWVGACKLLMECKIQFDTIDLQSDWSRYKLIVMPDACDSDRATGVQDKIQKYLKNGGSILASGDAVDVLPNDVVTRSEGGSVEPVYLSVKGDWAIDVPAMPHVLMSGYQSVEAPECEVLATLVTPYTSSSLELRYSGRQVPYCTHTENPVIVKKDRIFYVASPIFREYSEQGYGVHRQILAAAIKSLLPEPLVKGNLPLSFELAMFRQGDRVICFIVPYAPVRGDHVEQIEEWPTYTNLTIGVKGEFKTAYSAPEKVPMECRQDGAYTLVDLHPVRGPSVIVVE